MNNKIAGLHHITAIAGNAQRNYDFYTRVLGLRLVKKTVNFDDPGTYHFYFGNETGTPGTILTFFPWEGIHRGRTGTGMATEIGYSIPDGSLDFWISRFEAFGVKHQSVSASFGERYIRFEDPDGLVLKLIIPAIKDERKPWATSEVPEAFAIKGFHSVVLMLKNRIATEKILTDVFDYQFLKQEENVFRYQTNETDSANIIDIKEDPNGLPGVNAGGTNHHIAFRVRDEKELMYFRERIVNQGLSITGKIDRNYFYSLYFREPGGVLFEIATDNPGFVTDETLAELGTHLMLPSQYEHNRKKIEQLLPVLES